MGKICHQFLLTALVNKYWTWKENHFLRNKPGGDEKQENAKENQDESNCSEVLTLFQEAPCTSLSSVDKDTMRTPVAPRNSCTFWEFVQMMVVEFKEEKGF